jgi:outer membrane protein OmpA-like peptidoglycan-associated protein
MEAEQAREAAEAARQKAQKLAERVDELEAQQTERGLVLTLGDVLFDVDEATLKPGGQRAVTELKNFLSEYKERNVLIEGHTDNTGSDSYNQKLSQQRANAVRQALIGQGVAGTRIRSAGLGEQYPKASNNTNAGRQQNRRVEVIISDKSGEIPDRQ